MQEMSRNDTIEEHNAKLGEAMRRVQDAKFIVDEFQRQVALMKGQPEPTSPIVGKVRAEIVKWMEDQQVTYKAIGSRLQDGVDRLNSKKIV